MKNYILLIFIIFKFINGFLVRNHSTLSTHFNKINRIQPFYSKKYDIYRLRRQKEISDALESIFTRQRGIRIGNNITPDLIQGISIMEVKLNGDCTHADIYILASGDLFQQRQTFSWINKNLKRLRYLMAQLLSYRKSVPTLQFLPYDLESELKNINEESDYKIIEDGHTKNNNRWAGIQKQDDKIDENEHNTDFINNSNIKSPYKHLSTNKNKRNGGLLLIESV